MMLISDSGMAYGIGYTTFFRRKWEFRREVGVKDIAEGIILEPQNASFVPEPIAKWTKDDKKPNPGTTLLHEFMEIRWPGEIPSEFCLISGSKSADFSSLKIRRDLNASISL